ncbi:mercury methylation corrinoid protein HgcA [Thermodesulfobacteriota bacterium]
MKEMLPMAGTDDTCCEIDQKAPSGLPSPDQSFVNGTINTPVGEVPKVDSSLTWTDRVGSYKARWGIGRMHYHIEPGIYALGNPDENSRVLVTANYKMSFDRLREALPGKDFWMLVLDTNGINVWCAAGKGTFGTQNLVKTVESNGLERIVSHRELIVPQLGGPGIAAHQVKKQSGFKVIYGPIRAIDLIPFLNNGLKATPEMRTKTFTTWERTVLIPVELVAALKAAVIIIPILMIMGGILGPATFWSNVGNYGLLAGLAILFSILAGAVLTPILLPWIPGRTFSFKGLVMGLLATLIMIFSELGDFSTSSGKLEIISWFFMLCAPAMYMAMNFTGSSTYTSLSGVRKEMRWAVPAEIGVGVIGLGLWIWALVSA